MSTFISKLTLPVLAGVAGTLFLSYCIYFDHKRRTDPEFKKKLRDKRRSRKKINKDGSTALPDLKDHEAVQQFFLREVFIKILSVFCGNQQNLNLICACIGTTR